MRTIPMRGKRLVIVFVAIGVIALVELLAAFAGDSAHDGPRYNTTGSVPIGVYYYAQGPVERGNLAHVCLPAKWATYAKRYGILHSGSCPNNVEPIFKYYAAAVGDTVTFSPGAVVINNKRWPNSATPAAGTHATFGTFVVPKGEALFMGTSPDSWDGRFFGFLQVSAATGRMYPMYVKPGVTP